MSELRERIKLDIDRIRRANDRTGKLSERIFRWIGDPNGWRTMGDLADDLELLIGEENVPRT